MIFFWLWKCVFNFSLGVPLRAARLTLTALYIEMGTQRLLIFCCCSETRLVPHSFVKTLEHPRFLHFGLKEGVLHGFLQNLYLKIFSFMEFELKGLKKKSEGVLTTEAFALMQSFKSLKRLL